MMAQRIVKFSGLQNGLDGDKDYVDPTPLEVANAEAGEALKKRRGSGRSNACCEARCIQMFNLHPIRHVMKYFSHPPECVLYVCCGSECKSKGGKHLYKLLKSEVKGRHLKLNIQVIKTGCTDRCKRGPVVAVMPKNEWHLEVNEESAINILTSAAERSFRE